MQSCDRGWHGRAVTAERCVGIPTQSVGTIKKPIPKKPPKLRELIRLIAKRGGFLGRKGDGEPGVKTLWQGFMEIRTFASGLAYMRSSNAI